MKKLINTFIAFSVVLLTGCTVVKEPIFIETKCPKIKVLKPVPTIEGNITNDCVCGDNLYKLLRATSKLRATEQYYLEQVGKYNDKFTRTLTTDLDK